jgi:hypothetical protein
VTVGLVYTGQQVAQAIASGLRALNDNPIIVSSQVYLVAFIEGSFLRQRLGDSDGKTIPPALYGRFHLCIYRESTGARPVRQALLR